MGTEHIVRFLELRDVEMQWPLLPRGQHVGWGARQAVDPRRQQRQHVVSLLTQRETHGRFSRDRLATRVFHAYLNAYVLARLHLDTITSSADALSVLREVIIIQVDRRARVQHMEHHDALAYPWLNGEGTVSDDEPVLRRFIDYVRSAVLAFRYHTRQQVLVLAFQMNDEESRLFAQHLPSFRGVSVGRVLARGFSIVLKTFSIVLDDPSLPPSPSTLSHGSSEETLILREDLDSSSLPSSDERSDEEEEQTGREESNSEEDFVSVGGDSD